MYTAPTDDMQFLIDDVLDVGTVLGDLPHYAELGVGNELTPHYSMKPRFSRSTASAAVYCPTTPLRPARRSINKSTRIPMSC